MKLFYLRLIAVVGVFLGTTCLDSAGGQTLGAIYHSDTYAVTISMDRDPAYPSPSVLLVVKNISDKRIDSNDCSNDPRVWVQGEHGEPPTTYRERFGTLRLLPGEPDLACTVNMSYSLEPGESRTKHVLLKYLYDLHESGKYSVYVEIPAPEGWLRSNTAKFEVSESSTSQK